VRVKWFRELNPHKYLKKVRASVISDSGSVVRPATNLGSLKTGIRIWAEGEDK